MATQGKKVASTSREKRKLRIRKQVVGTVEKPRLSIFRSSKHTYAQLIVDEGHRTIASASTLDKEVQAAVQKLASAAEEAKGSTKSVLAARAVGLVLAERSKAAKVGQVVFDRNGFLYAGRVKALADGAREGGLNF
ncbi:MAG: 50S ribosomal protein L18 [Pseudomonadota bacterium]|jgi:large subunit ribosomal protein L18